MENYDNFHFSQHVLLSLGLGRVEPILGRSDEVETLSSDVVIAQAMASPERALELMHPWSSPTGLLVLPASESATPPATPDPAFELEPRSYVVPVSSRERRLWIFRRRHASRSIS